MRNPKQFDYHRWKNTIFTISASILLACVILSSSAFAPGWHNVFQLTGLTAQVTDDDFICYLSVGQADCAVIVNNGEVGLIDTGLHSKSTYVLDYLNSIGCRRLKYILITHTHDDHMGGLERIVSSIPVDNVVIGGMDQNGEPYNSDDDFYISAVSALNKAEQDGTSVINPSAGDSYAIGDAKINVIACSIGDSANDAGAVMSVQANGHTFLFTGDVTDRPLTELSEEQLKCDILKAGHHGANNANGMIESCGAQTIIFSCGIGNDYGHPHSDVIYRAKKCSMDIYRTDIDGNITVNTATLKVTVQYPDRLKMQEKAKDSSDK